MGITVSALRSEVASRFERLDLASWPDPRPDMRPPLGEEYSRVTDPGRFRIVHHRARLWVGVLEEALGARVEPLAPSTDGTGGTSTSDRGVRVTSRRPDALPLILLERAAPTRAGEEPLAVLEVAVARPDVVVEVQPGCGCDACDSGSGDGVRLPPGTEAFVGRPWL